MGGTVFISTIIKLELFTIREWLSLPYGAKILRMRQKIKEVNVMRLDKFLKVSRIIKRRTVAKEVADKGRIQINGVLAKSSSTVKIGDLVKIQFGNRILEVEVLQLNDSTKKKMPQNV